MRCGSVDRPSSRVWTEWVEWSSFVHVTVVPAATLIDDGAKRYDGGRSTFDVATGDGAAPAPGAHAAAARPIRSGRIVRATARRGMSALIHGAQRALREDRARDRAEHEDERAE